MFYDCPITADHAGSQFAAISDKLLAQLGRESEHWATGKSKATIYIRLKFENGFEANLNY